MIKIKSWSAAAVTAALAACGTANPPMASPPPSADLVEQQVASARRLAGTDLEYLMPVCRPQPAERARPSEALDDGIRRLMAQSAPEPGQAFDNLYFVGSAWVSAWVLKTSEGLVLIDALNNAAEAERLIEGGMRKLGLDPAQIKYLVITHGHGDHYGGAQMLARKYGARVIASNIDWDMMGSKLEFESKAWDPPPARDIGVVDGQKLTVGDTTITFYVTPGHTLGTLSPVFDVRDQGRKHKALIWGGTSFNFGRDMPRLDNYIAQTERMRTVSRQAGVDVPLSNHPGFDGTVAKLRTRSSNPSARSPFVAGTEVVDRALHVMGECARAQKTRFLIPA